MSDNTPEPPSTPTGRAPIRALVERYLARVARVMRRSGVPERDIEDASQETFVRVWQMQSKTGGLVSVLRIARFTALDYMRSKGRPRPWVRHEEMKEAERVEQQSADHRAMASDAERILREVLDKIPESQREVLALVDVEGCKLDEVATELSLDVSTVKSRLHSARARFNEELDRVRADEERTGRGLLVPILSSPSALIEAANVIDPGDIAAMQKRVMAGLVRALGLGVAGKLAMLSGLQLAAVVAFIFAAGLGSGLLANARFASAPEPQAIITAEPNLAPVAAELGPIASAAPSAIAIAAPSATAPASAQTAAPSGPDLHSDLGMLDAANALVNGDQPKRAIALLDKHAKRYPQSPFARMRESIRARAQQALAAQSDAGAPR